VCPIALREPREQPPADKILGPVDHYALLHR
jgi:hypothetical protein